MATVVTEEKIEELLKLYEENFELWFEKMSELARKEPELFEQVRETIIRKEIESSQNSDQLEKMQWKLNMLRKKQKTPLKSALIFYDMLLEKVYGEGGFLEALESFVATMSGQITTDRTKTYENKHTSETDKNNNTSCKKVIQLDFSARKRNS